MSEWSFTLLFDLPSANRHIVNGRDRRTGAMYAAARNRYARDLRTIARVAGVRLAYTVANGPPLTVTVVEPVPFRHVTLVRLMGRGQREWDRHDNLPAAFKPFVDAMQVERVHVGKGKVRTLIAGAGIVMSDSAKHAEFTYAQERAPDGKPGVLVTVSEDVRWATTAQAAIEAADRSES